MPVIFQIPCKVDLRVQPKKFVPLHITELETPLIPQPALGCSSCLCCRRRWTGTSTRVRRSGRACGSSLSPCIFTCLLHVIRACVRAGNGEERVASCCYLLLWLAPQLNKADLCIASSPLSFVHQSDISCLLVAATQVLQFPSQLSSSPMLPPSILFSLGCWQIPTSKITPVPSHRPLYLQPVLLLNLTLLLLPLHMRMTNGSHPSQHSRSPILHISPTSKLLSYSQMYIIYLPQTLISNYQN